LPGPAAPAAVAIAAARTLSPTLTAARDVQAGDSAVSSALGEKRRTALFRYTAVFPSSGTSSVE
jgi:hypothetical protein